MIRSPRLAGAGLLLAVLAACDQNGGPLSSDVRTSVPENIVALDCKVSVKPAASFGCAPAAPSTGANPVLTVGNQNVYVRLAASNLVFDAGTGIFSFDATVQNLLAQALGTTNGTTLDTNGVQVFFHSGPTSTGAGSVSVLNATGTGDFTGTEQPYYQYDAILAKDVVSSPKSWQFQVAGGATDFVFKVYVRAAVQYPEGYVTLSQRGDTLGTADTVRITHVVNNAVNTPLADQAVTWSSSNTGVATVDGSGLITAVAPGSAIISAVQGARTGQMTVRVCTSLAVGAVYTTGMPGASSLCLAGGAEYTYMPVNLSTSSALSLALTATGVGSVTGPPSPSIAAGQGSGLNLEAPRPNDDLHIAMMERDLRDVAGVLRNPAARVNRSGGSGTLRRNVVQGVPAVGDLMSLNTTSGCSGTRNDRTGKVMSVGQHVVIVADTMNPANGFTAAQYDSIALEFDTLVYPTDSTAFGTPADIDRNGRVVAFYTRAVNELTPPGSSSFVAGYFSARDLFSSAVGSCTLSNEGEMFYMLVPDPTGVVNGN
ncbi:MAG TPA: Ig-like domain-containing protein, partial [Longimicrobium sp.]|uniref:Ig-like domain-containing protein n=1 Tax=Longimicrobium sp. TaxID=2029185 RepID=UPI002EDBA82F